jgi:hypothetical protein
VFLDHQFSIDDAMTPDPSSPPDTATVKEADDVLSDGPATRDQPGADEAAMAASSAADAFAAGEWGVIGALVVAGVGARGFASERDGDFFVPPVNKVARINGVGQVLVSDVARQLMIARPS